MGQIRRFTLNLGKAKILKFKKTSGSISKPDEAEFKFTTGAYFSVCERVNLNSSEVWRSETTRKIERI